MEATRFFDPSEPETGFLSNFYAAEFALDGQLWPTVEHYFQAQKFVGTPWADAIRQAATPRAAKQLGQSRQHPLHPDWDAIRQRVMLRALVAKFVQNPELAQRLLASDGRLIEASPNDAYWGEGPDRLGANILGRLLMAVRAELPEADHQNMLAHGDVASLQARCEEAAWTLAQDPEFKHNEWTLRLLVNVLTSPFYGQSCRQIAHRLQPLLGKELAVVTAWRCLLEDFKGGFPDGWRLDWRDTGCANLLFRPDTTLRLAHWRMHSVAMDEVGPGDAPTGETRAELKSSLWHSAWRLEAVWALPGPDWDAVLKYHYPPVAEAIALELARRNHWTKRIQRRFLLIYGKPDEGLFPHADLADRLPGWPEASPYGARWEMIACTEAKGALPRVQEAFAKNFAYWDAELPFEDVVNRRAGNFDDTPLGDIGWSISYSFGRNVRGEYAKIESDHRKCGPDNYRIYADGSREEMPTYMDAA